MKRTNWMLLGFVVGLALMLIGSTAWASQENREQAKKARVELPAAVAKAIQDNVPNAEIDIAEVEKEAGLNLYDIEFKAGKGEIEVAEDSTVMDIATIIEMKDVPKLAAPKYIYAAELVKGEKKGEVQVAPDGKVIEGPKWGAEEAKEKEEIEEKDEAEEQEEKDEAEETMEIKAKPGVDLKILPTAVLNAFTAAYPKAVIRGVSKETEKGVTYYEIESVDRKMNRDLLYTADGKAVEVEESIAPGALPPAVIQALDKAYPGYKILKAEEILKDGQKLFELRIQVKDKKMSVTIDPNGKIIQ